MANALRGETLLSLGARSLLLRPTFAALLAAEAELGSLFRLLDRAASGDVRLADMAALFWHCAVEADCERATFEADLLAAGTPRLLEAYRTLLGAVFGRA